MAGTFCHGRPGWGSLKLLRKKRLHHSFDCLENLPMWNSKHYSWWRACPRSSRERRFAFLSLCIGPCSIKMQTEYFVAAVNGNRTSAAGPGQAMMSEYMMDESMTMANFKIRTWDLPSRKK